MILAVAIADPAIGRAVNILHKQGYTDLPEVVAVTVEEFPEIQDRIIHAGAFRVFHNGTVDPRVYILKTFWVYGLALKGDEASAVMLAATIVHEITHGNGGDELAARVAESKALGVFLSTHGNLSLTDRIWLKRQQQQIEHIINKLKQKS